MTLVKRQTECFVRIIALMQTATGKSSVHRDAVDYKMVTTEEAEALAAWGKYRALLNRIDTSIASDIELPEGGLLRLLHPG